MCQANRINMSCRQRYRDPPSYECLKPNRAKRGTPPAVRPVRLEKNKNENEQLQEQYTR